MNMKKILTHLAWSVFIALNLLFLFLVTGKKEQILPEEGKIVKIEDPVEYFIYENEEAVYKFTNSGSLEEVEFKHNEKNKIKNAKLIQNVFLKENNLPENAKWKIKAEGNQVLLRCETNDFQFQQTYSFEKNFIIKNKIEITNKSSTIKEIQPNILMNKKNFEEAQSFIFSGITIFANNTMQNLDKESLKEIETEKASSWASFNEKYFIFLLKNPETLKIEIKNRSINLINSKTTLKPLEKKEFEVLTVAAPKTIANIENIQKISHIEQFDNVFDYGWLFFLTKPFHYLFQLFINFFSNIIIALIVFTLMLKIITWPLATSGHIASLRMRKIAPEIEKIKEIYKNDSVQMNAKIFELYKKHGINPLSGCLPIVLQMILMFPLYKVLSFSIHLMHEPFLWISDLASKDNCYIINLFGLLNFSVPDILAIGIWPILMGISMFIQQELSSLNADENQKMIQYLMPFIFMFMMANIPTAVIIYWTLTNFLTIIQILIINHKEKKNG